MPKTVSNSAKNGGSRQKSYKYLSETALCNALDK
jgi:hypothetical protein